MEGLKLERLVVSRHWKGHMEGKIEFKNSHDESEITVVLEEKHIQGVLTVVADSVVAAAKEVATNLTRVVIEQAQPALAAPVEPGDALDPTEGEVPDDEPPF